MPSATRGVLPSAKEQCRAGEGSQFSQRRFFTVAIIYRLGIDALQSHEAQGFQVYEDARRGERAGEVEGEDRGWMEHRSLQQQTTGEERLSSGCRVY